MDNSEFWQETTDEHGISSIQVHEPKLVRQGCLPEEHQYAYDGNPQREVICTKCNNIQYIVIGLHTIQNGKIKTLSVK